jgi:hypothetical protein
LGGTETEVGTGEKMDKAPTGEAAMVLEFRRGTGGMQLAAKQWQVFASDYFHLVRRLHRKDEGT